MNMYEYINMYGYINMYMTINIYNYKYVWLYKCMVKSINLLHYTAVECRVTDGENLSTPY